MPVSDNLPTGTTHHAKLSANLVRQVTWFRVSRLPYKGNHTLTECEHSNDSTSEDETVDDELVVVGAKSVFAIDASQDCTPE
jgi:hypothetical protein